MARKKQSRKQPKSNPLPVFLLVAGGVLLLVALVLILTRNNPSTGTASSANPEERVSLARAKAAFDAGEAVFVDVRGPAGYNAGHMPGAVLIPLNEFEDRWNELDPNDWIITYCTWPAEESSVRAAQILVENGFTRVNALQGGFQAWNGAGYPVETE